MISFSRRERRVESLSLSALWWEEGLFRLQTHVCQLDFHDHSKFPEASVSARVPRSLAGQCLISQFGVQYSTARRRWYPWYLERVVTFDSWRGLITILAGVFYWALSIVIPLLDLSAVCALILLAVPWCHVVDFPFLCGRDILHFESFPSTWGLCIPKFNSLTIHYYVCLFRIPMAWWRWAPRRFGILYIHGVIPLIKRFSQTTSKQKGFSKPNSLEHSSWLVAPTYPKW